MTAALVALTAASLCPRFGFVVRGSARRFLRAIAGVDGTRKGETIVALVDRFVGLLKRGGRRGEALGRVLLGARGACRCRSPAALDRFLSGEVRSTPRGARPRT